MAVSRKECGEALATIVNPSASKAEKDKAAETIQTYIDENPGKVN